MRLRGINTVADANAYAPSFMATYNARFAKPPKSDFNAHRPLRADESLDLTLTWRAPRKITKSLSGSLRNGIARRPRSCHRPTTSGQRGKDDIG